MLEGMCLGWELLRYLHLRLTLVSVADQGGFIIILNINLDLRKRFVVVSAAPPLLSLPLALTMLEYWMALRHAPRFLLLRWGGGPCGRPNSPRLRLKLSDSGGYFIYKLR
jgi:hypothetical protein